MINAEDCGSCDLLLNTNTFRYASEDANQYISLECIAAWPSIIIPGTILTTYNVTISGETGPSIFFDLLTASSSSSTASRPVQLALDGIDNMKMAKIKSAIFSSNKERRYRWLACAQQSHQ